VRCQLIQSQENQIIPVRPRETGVNKRAGWKFLPRNVILVEFDLSEIGRYTLSVNDPASYFFSICNYCIEISIDSCLLVRANTQQTVSMAISGQGPIVIAVAAGWLLPNSFFIALRCSVRARISKNFNYNDVFMITALLTCKLVILPIYKTVLMD